MRILSVVVLAILFISILSAQQDNRVINLSVTSEGRDIKITWEMTEQTGVQFFHVERRTVEQDNFVRISESPIFLNQSKKYEFIDRSVYKQENVVVFYRVAVINSNGAVTYSEPAPLGKISSVQRTWGSIKSMFR